MTTTSHESKSQWHRWLSIIALTAPILLGYVPVGFAFGVLSQKAGISTANTLLMSLLVYAGSAQLVGAGLMAAGAAPLSIILTTFIINLRHLLMSAAIAPFLKGWRKHELAAFAYELTDEMFAVHTTRFATEKPSKPEIFAINVTAQITWIVATWLGIVAGQLITDVKPLALDYALPAMFVGLLLLQLKTRIQLMVAVLTGLMAVGLLFAGLDRWNVIVATIIGATIGVGIEQWINARSS